MSWHPVACFTPILFWNVSLVLQITPAIPKITHQSIINITNMQINKGGKTRGEGLLEGTIYKNKNKNKNQFISTK